MSLHINTLRTITAISRPKTVDRIFTISPSLYGRTTWNVDVQGPINISSSGQWTIIPTSTFSATVKMWGAAGARAYVDYKGGGGGYSAGTASFHSDTSYVIVVGAGGNTVASGIVAGYTIGGGGYGRSSTRSNPQGGGLSGIFAASYTQNNSILVAGGGGGAGFSSIGTGPGGGLVGGNSGIYGEYTASGGTQTAGGQPSYTGTAGGALLGGLGSTGANRSGGGGGGYYGGGSGANGAGGSGYINTEYVSNGITNVGNNATPANPTDIDRKSSGENIGTNMFGNDGRVIIS